MERNVSTIMKKIKCWLGGIKPEMGKNLDIQHRSGEEKPVIDKVEAKPETDEAEETDVMDLPSAKKKSTPTKKPKANKNKVS